MDRCAIVISLELGHGLFGCSFLFFVGFFFRISRIHPTDQVQVKCFFFYNKQSNEIGLTVGGYIHYSPR